MFILPCLIVAALLPLSSLSLCPEGTTSGYDNFSGQNILDTFKLQKGTLGQNFKIQDTSVIITSIVANQQSDMLDIQAPYTYAAPTEEDPLTFAASFSTKDQLSSIYLLLAGEGAPPLSIQVSPKSTGPVMGQTTSPRPWIFANLQTCPDICKTVPYPALRDVAISTAIEDKSSGQQYDLHSFAGPFTDEAIFTGSRYSILVTFKPSSMAIAGRKNEDGYAELVEYNYDAINLSPLTFSLRASGTNDAEGTHDILSLSSVEFWGCRNRPLDNPVEALEQKANERQAIAADVVTLVTSSVSSSVPSSISSSPSSSPQTTNTSPPAVSQSSAASQSSAVSVQTSVGVSSSSSTSTSLFTSTQTSNRKIKAVVSTLYEDGVAKETAVTIRTDENGARSLSRGMFALCFVLVGLVLV